MAAEPSILKSIRLAVGLDAEDDSFDGELLMHINGGIMTLNQNGIGRPVIVTDDSATWDELKDPSQDYANEMFVAVKSYIFVKTKILFDPPPPSTIKYMSEAVDEYLWRLRESFDVGLDGLILEEVEI